MLVLSQNDVDHSAGKVSAEEVKRFEDPANLSGQFGHFILHASSALLG